MLRKKIQEDLTTAMKNKDAETTSALRLIIAKIKEKDVEIRGRGGRESIDTDIIGIMQGMIKQRRDSIKMFIDGNRPELALKEEKEISVIEKYLPKMMSDEETVSAIKAIISEVNAMSAKDMGLVMAKLKEKYAGQVDMGKASLKIKEFLNS